MVIWFINSKELLESLLFMNRLKIIKLGKREGYSMDII